MKSNKARQYHLLGEENKLYMIRPVYLTSEKTVVCKADVVKADIAVKTDNNEIKKKREEIIV